MKPATLRKVGQTQVVVDLGIDEAGVELTKTYTVDRPEQQQQFIDRCLEKLSGKYKFTVV